MPRTPPRSASASSPARSFRSRSDLRSCCCLRPKPGLHFAAQAIGPEHHGLRDDALSPIEGDGGRAIKLVSLLEGLRHALAETLIVGPGQKPVFQPFAHPPP